MPAMLKHLAWGLATAALMIAVPLRAAGGAASVPENTASNVPAAVVATPPAATQETGAGWNEVYCAACVGIGTFALYSGGISMLPVLLANAQTVGTIAGTCVMSCRSVLADLMD